MKIAFVIPSLARGGAERVASILGNEWSRSGHQVEFFVFERIASEFSVSAVVVDLGAAPTQSTWGKVWNLVSRTIRFRRFLKQRNYDRIFSFLEGANLVAFLATAGSREREKLVMSIRVDPNSIWWPQRILCFLFYRFKIPIVVQATGSKTQLVSWGFSSDKLHVIPNPLNSSEVAELSRSRPVLSIELPKFFLIGVGRLVPQKGFDILIRIFSQLARDFSNLHLVIVGDGQEEFALKRQAEASSYHDKIHFIGSLDNPFWIMAQAHVLVLSSRFEGFGNVITEAMASGCPVVAFDCPHGPAEIIDHEQTGLLVAVGDEYGLRECVRKLLLDSSCRESICQNARLTLKNYDPTDIAKRWLLLGRQT